MNENVEMQEIEELDSTIAAAEQSAAWRGMRG